MKQAPHIRSWQNRWCDKVRWSDRQTDLASYIDVARSKTCCVIVFSQRFLLVDKVEHLKSCRGIFHIAPRWNENWEIWKLRKRPWKLRYLRLAYERNVKWRSNLLMLRDYDGNKAKITPPPKKKQTTKSEFRNVIMILGSVSGPVTPASYTITLYWEPPLFIFVYEGIVRLKDFASEKKWNKKKKKMIVEWHWFIHAQLQIFN